MGKRKILFLVLSVSSLFLGLLFLRGQLLAQEQEGRFLEFKVEPDVKGVMDIVFIQKNRAKLEKALAEKEVKGWWITNVLKIGIRQAIKQDASAETLALILFFPIAATVIAFSRNIVGLKGFGFFTQATFAIAFIAVGAATGVFLLLTSLILATVARLLISRVRLRYWPRMAIITWFSCLGIFVLFLINQWIRLESLNQISISSILLFFILSGNFIKTQIDRTSREVILITVETMVFSIIVALLANSLVVQKTVLLYPEITLLLTLLANYLISLYKGLRLLEIWRFRELLRR